MNRKLTLDEVVAVAEELVAKRPDYVYPSYYQMPEGQREELRAIKGDIGLCHYERFGKPSCLIGQILHKFGVTVEELAVLDTCGEPGTDIGTLIRNNLIPNIAVKEPKTIQFLINLQQRQDYGHPWGCALAYAKDSISSREAGSGTVKS